MRTETKLKTAVGVLSVACLVLWFACAAMFGMLHRKDVKASTGQVLTAEQAAAKYED